MSQYGAVEYWEARYTRDPEPFDWLQRYGGLRDVMTGALEKTLPVLYSGCGTSRLPDDMLHDGFTSVTGIDTSQAAIAAQQARYKGNSSLRWEVCSACDLSRFPAASFGGVVMKGTFDALLCGDGSTTNVARAVAEAARVLMPGGALIIVSYGAPDKRLPHLTGEAAGGRWASCVTHTVPKPVIGGGAGVGVAAGAGAAVGAVAAPTGASATSPGGDGGGSSGGGSGGSAADAAAAAAGGEHHYVYVCRKA